jgi:GAF domain
MTGFRAVAVVAFSLFVLAAIFPNITDVWHPIVGDFGFALSADNTIVAVRPGSGAAAAGLRVGDRIDPARNSPRDRLMLAPPGNSLAFPRPGQSLTVYVLRNFRDTPVRVVAQEGAASHIMVVLKRVTGLIFVIVGTLLLLLRPSRMTWGFYLYAVGNNGGSPLVFEFLPPIPYFILNHVASYIPGALAPVGLLIFALRFPTGKAEGWRLNVDRIMPFLGVALIFLTVYPSYMWVFQARTSQVSALWTTYPAVVVLTIALGIALSTYFKSAGVDRQRISWVIFGLTVSYAGNIIAALADYYVAWPYAVTPDVFVTLNIAVPITVAYSIARHRILDINFVFNRALVYGAITLVIVGIFALIDWFFTRTLSSKLGLFADIGAALIIGITLDRLHHRIDHVMDSVFFRRRHNAEVRLKRLAAALPHAMSLATVDLALVEEPSDWLQLASAAVFRRDSGSRYVRRAAIGWSEVMSEELSIEDRLVLQLEAEQDPLHVDDVHWKRTDLPEGAARPALVVPIVIRRRLEGFALYGSHRGGEAIDPDEQKALEGLMMGAASAYDHLEAEALREENRRLREERVAHAIG